MRFLMLNWRDPKSPRSGGAERVSLGYLAALVRRGHEAYWFTHEFPGCKPREEIEGVNIVRKGGTATSFLHAMRWYRLQKPFHLVIDQHHGIPWFAPWWCNTRCVSFIHEVLGPIWNSFYRWPWNSIGQFQERWTHWLYRRVPFWTACDSTRKSLESHGVKNVTVIPYGVSTVALPQLKPKDLTEPLRLIVVARLAPNKRVDHAIRALKILCERNVPARLKIVGTGEMEQPLKELVDELGVDQSVEFMGSLSEETKDAALEEAHFLLHTSLREGWGLNVIEANAMGTPAAVYPVAGLVESTLHDQTGMVSEAETPGSLAECLIRVLNAGGKYEEYRRKAWDRSKTFHWSAVLPQACDWLEAQARSARKHS